MLAPAGKIGHAAVHGSRVHNNRVRAVGQDAQVHGLIQVTIAVAGSDDRIDALAAEFFHHDSKGKMHLPCSPGAVDSLQIDFLRRVDQELKSLDRRFQLLHITIAAENVDREYFDPIGNAGDAISVPICGNDACHMGPMGGDDLGLVLRVPVTAGVHAVFSAAVPGLLLRREFIKHPLQIGMICINAGIHDADCAAGVGWRIGIRVPFLPARYLQAVAAGGRERGRIIFRFAVFRVQVACIPLHEREVRPGRGIGLLRARFILRAGLPRARFILGACQLRVRSLRARFLRTVIFPCRRIFLIRVRQIIRFRGNDIGIRIEFPYDLRR